MPKNPKPGQGAEPTNGPATAQAPVKVATEERDEFVTRLIGRHGNAIQALTQIAGEVLGYRKRTKRAESALAEMKDKLPAADAVVLTGEEAKTYNDLKAKGLTLDKVPAKLKEFDDLQTTMASTAREKGLTDAVGKKYDLTVLKRLLGDTKIEFKTINQMKEDKSGIETVLMPFVILPDGKTQEALDTYVDREFKSFESVLKVKEGDESNRSDDTPRMPKQNSSSSSSVPAKDKAVFAIVDKATSGFVTPSQRRKESAGAAK